MHPLNDMQLAVKDGSGFTEDEILDHVRLEQHASFLKSHMSQNSDTLGGKILTWLTEEYLVSISLRNAIGAKLRTNRLEIKLAHQLDRPPLSGFQRHHENQRR